MSTLKRITLLVGALLLLPILWGFWLEPASLRSNLYQLQLPTLPSECSGLRIAVLADIHTGSPFNGLDKLRKIVALTNAATPDLVLLTGDYVIHNVMGGSFVPPKAIARELAGLQAAAGIYAVLGNHDQRRGTQWVQHALETAGIAVLEDRSRLIESGACQFWLAGVSDYHKGVHDVDAALAEVPPDAVTIAFTHNPDIFPAIPDWVTLTAAGHTHGGQVYIPGLGLPIVPSQYGSRFSKGHIVENGRHLFVSSGLGTSILPVRFLVPPEISVLTLRP